MISRWMISACNHDIAQQNEYPAPAHHGRHKPRGANVLPLLHDVRSPKSSIIHPILMIFKKHQLRLATSPVDIQFIQRCHPPLQCLITTHPLGDLYNSLAHSQHPKAVTHGVITTSPPLSSLHPPFETQEPLTRSPLPQNVVYPPVIRIILPYRARRPLGILRILFL